MWLPRDARLQGNVINIADIGKTTGNGRWDWITWVTIVTVIASIIHNNYSSSLARSEFFSPLKWLITSLSPRSRRCRKFETFLRLYLCFLFSSLPRKEIFLNSLNAHRRALLFFCFTLPRQMFDFFFSYLTEFLPEKLFLCTSRLLWGVETNFSRANTFRLFNWNEIWEFFTLSSTLSLPLIKLFFVISLKAFFFASSRLFSTQHQI